MRIDQLRARRVTVVLLWFFVAVPSAAGVLLLVKTGWQSFLGWTIVAIFVLATLYLGYLFVKANTLPIAVRTSGSGRFGLPQD